MADFKLGNTDISDIKLGSTQVKEVYYVGTKIWPISTTWSGWSGLTAYWSMDNVASTTVYDDIGSNDLTAVGSVTYPSGINNNGILFNAAGERLDGSTSSPNFEYNSTFTISYWVKRSVTTVFSPHIQKQNRSEPYRGWSLLFLGDNRYYMEMYGDAGRYIQYITTTTYTDTSDFYHFVFTYAGTSTLAGAKLYCNGSQITSFDTQVDNLAGSIQNTFPFRVGRYDNINENAQSTFDEIAIWDRVLSATEVSELYNSGSGIFY